MRRGFLTIILALAWLLGMVMPAKSLPADKIITITVNEIGFAVIGRDTLTMEQLIVEIQTRLWKSYLGTGKMYDALKLEFTSGVAPEVQNTAKESLHEAQNRALIDLCLQKHKRRFEDLDSHQQEKIQKQFPVLFQKEFN